MNGYAPVVFTPASPIWDGQGAEHWLAVTQPAGNPLFPFRTWLSDPETCTTLTLPNVPHQHWESTHVLAPFELDGNGDYKRGPNLYLLGGYTATSDEQEGCGTHAPHGEVSYFNAATKSWETKAAMSIPRHDHNALLLPDGQILVVGGSKKHDCCGSNPTGNCGPDYELPPIPDPLECVVKIPELYNPVTNTWKRLSVLSKPRTYHSVTLLLPDGRVFVGGGEYIKGDPPPVGECPDGQNADHMTTVEIFKPPYTFKSGRPSIVPLASDQATYGQPLIFDVSGWLSGNSRVMLIRQGSVTHGHEMSQRTVHLKINSEVNLGSTWRITAQVPTAATGLLPPGWYMLWVVANWSNSDERRPCLEAQWVQLGASPFAPPSDEEPFARATPPIVPAIGVVVTGLAGSVDVDVTTPLHLVGTTVEIYDVNGRHVRTLSSGLSQGETRLHWDGTSEGGRTMPAGVYLLRATGLNDQTHVQKLVLVR